MTEDPKYWQDLVDQYKRGTITAEDRYILEKRALDDPFLFDALEGYALYGTADQDTQRSFRKSRTLPLRWIGAAAAILIAILSALFLMQGEGDTNETQAENIAMVLETETTQATPDPSPSAIESKDKPSKASPEKGKESNTVQTKPTPAHIDHRDGNKDKDIADTEGQAAQEDLINTETHDPIVSPTSSDGDRSADAAIVDNSEELAEIGEVETVQIDASSNTFSEEDADNQIQKKKNSSFFYPVEPMIGKKDFDDYVKQQILARGLQQDPPQEVIIEFTIDREGNLSEFTHIDSQCSVCGSMAISILNQSGVWRTIPAGQTGRARYTFVF